MQTLFYIDIDSILRERERKRTWMCVRVWMNQWMNEWMCCMTKVSWSLLYFSMATHVQLPIISRHQTQQQQLITAIVSKWQTQKTKANKKIVHFKIVDIYFDTNALFMFLFIFGFSFFFSPLFLCFLFLYLAYSIFGGCCSLLLFWFWSRDGQAVLGKVRWCCVS